MWPSGFSLKAGENGADVDSCFSHLKTVEDQWLQVKGAGRLGGCEAQGPTRLALALANFGLSLSPRLEGRSSPWGTLARSW